VRATALAAEAYLRGRLSPAATAGSVVALGRNEARLTFEGRQWRLGRRHSELLVLLLAHPEGSTGDELGFGLYGDDASPVTVRAELSRLRRALGPELMESRPYRLRAEVEADFRTVVRLLEHGRVTAALEAYAGPLLPGSEAPGVVRLRRLVDDRLRAALLAAGDRTLLQTWLHSPWGADDLEAWEAYARLLPPTAPARPLALGRIRELQVEYGVATSLQRGRN
jgi:hypothetical protein